MNTPIGAGTDAFDFNLKLLGFGISPQPTHYVLNKLYQSHLKVPKVEFRELYFTLNLYFLLF